MKNLLAFRTYGMLRIIRSITFVIFSLILFYTLHTVVSNDRADERIDKKVTTAFDEGALEHRRRQVLSRVISKHPWFERTSYHPNYFIYRGRIEDYDTASHNNTMVFLHHQKAGGSTVKICLKKIRGKDRKKVPRCVGIYDKNGADHIENEIIIGRGDKKCYVGENAFGVCDDFHNNKCSYFTMLRDPYERVISSYEYCRMNVVDPLCEGANPTTSTLKQWALLQGSYFFRQLLYNPTKLCANFSDDVVNSHGSYDDQSDVVSFPLSAPCWYRQKIYLEGVLDRAEKEALLEYVLGNLKKWFAVIGVTEDFAMSLKLLQKVYGLPFYDQCNSLVTYQSDYKGKGDRDRIIKNLKKQLEADSDVSQALHYDLKIYQKAMEIFIEQKEIYSKMS